MEKNFKIPSKIIRSFPWIVWMLWKNRNNFFFEGKSFFSTVTIMKINEESDLWFQAQVQVSAPESMMNSDPGKLKRTGRDHLIHGSNATLVLPGQKGTN